MSAKCVINAERGLGFFFRNIKLKFVEFMEWLKLYPVGFWGFGEGRW